MSKRTAIRTAALGAALCASGALSVTLAPRVSAAESLEAVFYRDVNCLAVSLSGITETRSLWVAMDATDKGETAADWSHWCHATDVAAGTTAVEVVLPSTTAVKNGKMLRCALLPVNALPGAERLTSVTPSSALVPTGFRPTGRSRVELDVQLGSGAQALFCSRYDGGVNKDFFSVMHNVQAGTLRYDYGTRPGGYNSYGPVSDYTRYVIAMGASGLYTTESDGTVNELYRGTPIDFTAGSDLYLFGTHSNGSNPGAYFNGEFFGFKAWSDDADPDSLALELVPARKNGVVGLFDSRGGDFRTPSNDGSLTAGDKTADAGVPLAWSAATGMENILAVAACDAGAKRLDIRSDKVTAPGSLWVAYGTADAGERISDWPHFACVGELDVGETFKQVRLPKGWSDEVRYVRVFLLAPDALPDATRLASVSPRSALLKTSFRPTGQSRVELDVQLGSGTQALFCSRLAANSANYFSVLHNVESGKLRYDYGTRPGGYISYGTVADSTRYVIAMGAAGLCATKIADGTVNKLYTGTPSDFTAGSDLYLFGLHNNGLNSGNYFNGVFYGFKAWDVDTMDPDCLALDLVPAKKDSVVGLYDRRSGDFLTQSTGALEAGAELSGPDNVQAVSCAYEHAPCTVAVVSQTSRRLTVALSGVETDSELWIVADVQDRADDVLGWNEYVKVADIVRGQTEATVSLPKAWREQALKLRCILYSKEASPGCERYYAVRPWSASANTEVVPTGKTSVEITARYDANPAAGEGLFCARGAGSTNPFALMYLTGYGLRFDYKTANPVDKFLTLPLGTRQVLRVDAAGLTLNDAASPQLPNTTGEQTFTAGGELYLLSMHAGGGSIGSYMTGMFCGSRAWSDYQNRTDETLLFDIVPCRRNGVVALVDRKTHEVVPHAGTLAAGEMEFMGTGVIAQSATVSSLSGFMIIVR